MFRKVRFCICVLVYLFFFCNCEVSFQLFVYFCVRAFVLECSELGSQIVSGLYPRLLLPKTFYPRLYPRLSFLSPSPVGPPTCQDLIQTLQNSTLFNLIITLYLIVQALFSTDRSVKKRPFCLIISFNLKFHHSGNSLNCLSMV